MAGSAIQREVRCCHGRWGAKVAAIFFALVNPSVVDGEQVYNAYSRH